LSRADVEDGVRDPDQVVPGQKGRLVAQKQAVSPTRGQPALLRVIFEEREGRRLILNAYLTTKVEKYWRKEP
jgi:hypothetical protein